MTKLFLAFALFALSAPAVWAVPLGSRCSSNEECQATTPASACTFGLCAPTDGTAIIPEGELGGSCLAGDACNGDLVCSEARCVAPIDGATTCSETVACPDNHKCSNGVCVKAGENGDKCDSGTPCADGYSCALGYCIGTGAGQARCECTCNGDTSSLAPKLPADSCSVCGAECDKMLQYVCTSSGFGLIGDKTGQRGFQCVQANADTGDAETVTGNPDGTVTVTPGGELDGSLTPSGAAAAAAFPSALAALAILAIAVGVQL